MASRLDDRIHALMQQVVDETPLPPALPEPPSVPMHRPIPSWAIVAAAAIAGLVIIGTGSLLLGGSDGSIVPLPPAGTDGTIAPTPTTALTPASVGTITVDVSGLTDARGHDLAGVLMEYRPDLASPETPAWRGIGGFSVPVDANPFATSAILGVVEAELPDDHGSEPWPWDTGEPAQIPAGDYTLWLWTGTDMCCYSRWVPASPGLRGCEFHVTTTGEDQTIYIDDIPLRGPCTTNLATASTGTATISMRRITGMEGYRLLAGVWSLDADRPLVGGAFWTIIDSDPFTDTDRVHPPVDPDIDTEIDWELLAVEGWAADDYLWNITAQLEPGAYEVTLWANPGELAPYGSHIPGGTIERSCAIEIEVRAGFDTGVVVTDFPPDHDGCTHFQD